MFSLKGRIGFQARPASELGGSSVGTGGSEEGYNPYELDDGCALLPTYLGVGHRYNGWGADRVGRRSSSELDELDEIEKCTCLFQ